MFLGIGLSIAYALICLVLYAFQRQLIYRPTPTLSLQPDSSDFNLAFEEVQVAIANSPETLHGWWIPAHGSNDPYVILPDEPINILDAPKTVLYFYGIGNNKGDYNHLARVSAFRQLGFSVFVVDYRGYGASSGDFPSEAQLYEDAAAAWNYLREIRRIPAAQIVIYGESMGGAIALDLAIKQPAANSVIVQSSFTSMTEAVRQKKWLQLFPIEALLNEKFESLTKISDLQIPVLLLHGEQDSVVPVNMSHRLYAAAPNPKELFLIPDADHVRIYQSGTASYLKAIQGFLEDSLVQPN